MYQYVLIFLTLEYSICRFQAETAFNCLQASSEAATKISVCYSAIIWIGHDIFVAGDAFVMCDLNHVYMFRMIHLKTPKHN